MDHRQAAQDRLKDLVALVDRQPAGDQKNAFLEECAALTKAIAAFHMEGIRFRSYNVERLLHKGGLSLPPQADEIFASMRHELEAAGFHTRSHQSPSA
jgi:hypothetical protein